MLAKLEECSHTYEWVVYDSGKDKGTCTKCGAVKTLDPSTSTLAPDVITEINKYREAEGLQPLEWRDARCGMC